MVRVPIFILLFTVIALVGCSNEQELQTSQTAELQSLPTTETQMSQTSEIPVAESKEEPDNVEISELVKVMEENQGWSESVEHTLALREGMTYIGCNEKGYFFLENIQEINNSDMGAWRYGFTDWSGEETVLLETRNVYYSTQLMCGDSLIVAISARDDTNEGNSGGVKIFRLQDNGEADVILEQTKHTLPSLYDNGNELIVVTRDLDKDTQATISRLIIYNLITEEQQLIAEAEMSAYKNGERFMCAGGNDKDIYYVINSVKGDEIVRYSRLNGEIVARCPMEYYVDFITGVGDMVIISETDDNKYLEKAGHVGILSQDSFEKVCEIPLVEAARKIREARVVGENIYFATPGSAYLLENGDNHINLYTLNLEEPINGGRMSALDVSDNGISFLVNGCDIVSYSGVAEHDRTN